MKNKSKGEIKMAKNMVNPYAPNLFNGNLRGNMNGNISGTASKSGGTATPKASGSSISGGGLSTPKISVKPVTPLATIAPVVTPVSDVVDAPVDAPMKSASTPTTAKVSTLSTVSTGAKTIKPKASQSGYKNTAALGVQERKLDPNPSARVMSPLKSANINMNNPFAKLANKPINDAVKKAMSPSPVIKKTVVDKNNPFAKAVNTSKYGKANAIVAATKSGDKYKLAAQKAAAKKVIKKTGIK